jgi:RNA polymerase sigma-70 factor (ECF subfamily)
LYDHQVSRPPVNDPTDSEGVPERAPSGDHEAFEAMFREFAAPLRRFARGYVASPESAAEIVQDIFLNVWRTPRVFETREQLRAYLFRATRNRALDYLEKEGVRTRWREESLRDVQAGMADDDAHGAHEAIERAELLGIIDSVLKEMPARRRAVCELRWKHGLPLADIAARMDISAKTVEIQIGRGLKQVRARLGS